MLPRGRLGHEHWKVDVEDDDMCEQRSVNGRRKRTIFQVHSTEEGGGRRRNKQKRMAIENKHKSGAMKSQSSSKEIHGKKFRRLDTIHKGSSGQLHEHKNERNGQISHHFVKKRSEELLSRFQDHLSDKDDWTEEYIWEPRKLEKKKTLKELQMAKIEPVFCWFQRSKRRSRTEMQDEDKYPKQVQTRTKNCEDNVSLRTDCGISKEERGNIATPRNFSEVNNDDLNKSTHYISCEDVSPGTGSKLPTLEIQNNVASSINVCALSVSPSTEGSDKIIISSQTMKISSHDGGLTIVDHDNDCPVTAMDQNKAGIQTNIVGITMGHAGIREKNLSSVTESEVKLTIPEGRRCGLCRGDSDGELPIHAEDLTFRLAEGKDASYSNWEQFGNFPGWLGNLLGPLVDDRFGITGIWVHQECAIWSPEVYFAGIGQLRNVRAALRRGRVLKCSRCGQAGATIGCRVDRCQRTYHLPCARFDFCLFDNKKYLMACSEHKHVFLPRISGNVKGKSRLAERLQFEKMLAERERVAKAALQRDLEDEQKWIDNTGEDEEFTRREERRLQRNLARIRPVFVGGPDGKHYQENWDLLAGLRNVVQCMKEMVVLPLLYPEVFSRLGITPPRGLLLHGYPGTGKTLAVRALVGACSKGDRRVAFFPRKGADCLGKYVGDAERELRMLFHVAEQHQPSIIFFDEIDGLAPKRSIHQDQTQKSVVSTLLALMDGLHSRGNVIVVCATNRLDALDPALRRPGRFDREIYFPLPSSADRSSILAVHTRKWETPPPKSVLSFLAQQTSGFAGADLQALCAQAAMRALKKVVPMKDILNGNEGGKRLQALPSFTVTFSDWVAALKEMPLPCSHRVARAATNEVPSSPLPCYMLPALLWPMVELLIMLHLDQRVVLPPRLQETAVLTKNILESTTSCMLLESSSSKCIWLAKNMEPGSLRASLFKRLEDMLIYKGMVYNIEADQQEVADIFQMPYLGSRFHIMFAGSDTSGIESLSAWLLHGFEGFAELRKLSLPIMLEGGGGDVLLGLLAILGEVKYICPCVIFMPQIELWAMEDSADSNAESQLIASQGWKLFMQQMNLFPVDSPFIILASCGAPKKQIPSDILKFFGMTSSIAEASSSSLSESDFSCRDAGLQFDFMNSKEARSSCGSSVPCVWIDFEGCPESSLVLDRAARFYAKLLSLKFIHSIPCFRKLLLLPDYYSEKQMEMDFPVRFQVLSEVLFEDNNESQGFDEAGGRQRHEHQSFKEDAGSGKHNDSFQINASEQVVNSLLVGQSQLSRCDELLDCGPMELTADKWSPQQKALYIAVASCGYQLLHDPKLKELRRATSKLTDGPFIDIKGMQRSFRSEFKCQKGYSSDGLSGQKKRQYRSSLKGLLAVGLLAYKGMYLMPSEVAYGVRSVLGLLRKKIDLKVRKGKNKLLFFQLRSQAAALEDHVFHWAFNLRSLEKAVQVSWSFIHRMNFEKRYDLGYGFECTAESLTTRKCKTNFDQSQQSLGPPHFDQALDVANPVTDGHLSPSRCTLEALQLEKKHEPERSEDLSVRPTFLVKSWKYCVECLHQVEHLLHELFYGFWRLKGCSKSLVAVNDVIGTCLSSVSASLACSDGSYVSIHDLKSCCVFSVASDGAFCACVKDHRHAMTMCSHKELNSTATRTKCKDTDGDFTSLFTRGDATGKKKPYNEVLSSDALTICLCPLIQKIHSLIPSVG